MRRRAKTRGDDAVAASRGRQVIADWHGGGRARIEAQNLALQDVDLGALDDAAVAEHARRCLEHCVANVGAPLLAARLRPRPARQYLFEAAAWGLEPAELLPLLEGASPSTSEPAAAAASIRAARRGTRRAADDARRACARSSPDDRRRASTTTCATAARCCSRRYDLDGVTLGERPDLVLASILNAEHARQPPDRSPSATRGGARAGARSSTAHGSTRCSARPATAMDLRDDNGPTTAEWPLGLLRLALLELGRRLVAAGPGRTTASTRSSCSADELGAGAVHQPAGRAPTCSPSARRDARSAEAAATAPPRSVRPSRRRRSTRCRRPLAHLVGMVQTVMSQMGDGTGGAARGERAARHRHRHRVGARHGARVADSPEEALDVLEPGDILVVAGTTPAYNLVLSIAGGVVTAEGGPLSHAAVLARELGIPAVVGAAGGAHRHPRRRDGRGRPGRRRGARVSIADR